MITIRSVADEWWKFDDDKVSPVTAEEVLKLNGGGMCNVYCVEMDFNPVL